MSRRIVFFTILLWSSFTSFPVEQQSSPDSVRKTMLAAAGDSTRNTSVSLRLAAHDTTSWFEKHPAQTGLIGAVIGALVALIAVFVSMQTRKKAKAHARAAKTGEKEGEHEFEKEIEIQAHDEIERRYLNGVKNEHESIKLYGFQSRVNLDVRTLDVFVSLRLTEERHHDAPGEFDADEHGRHLSPEGVLQSALRKKRLLLIIGDPGSGKTTLLKYYAICCLDEKGRQRLKLSRPLLPILLPLRKVNPQLPFTEALSAWATRRNRPVSAKLFDEWLEKRGALVLLDGLDEISDLGLRKAVCEWIDNAAQYYGNSQFVVTSRYTGYRVAEGVELHADHLHAEVLDLDAGQQELFLKNWFAAIYGRQSEDADLSPEARQQEAAAQAQDLAEAVQLYLAKPESESLRRMAGTPMLLQIMAILWKEYHNLPPARAALYEKCLDYLLDYRDSDREKEITPLLPADDAKIVLRPLCLWMQEIHRNDEVTLKEIATQISKPLEEVKPGTKPLDFIQNLYERAGILQQFGDGGYLFRHKSFREYLAATHLAEEIKSEAPRVRVLVENFHEGWWRETILFSLSLPKPVIFADFFAHFLPHECNTPNALPLLELAIKEARQKSVEPFAEFVLDLQQNWQKRYNALHCLRLIASEPTKALVQRVWELEKKRDHQNHEDYRLLQKAEEILIEWKLHRPEPPPAPAVHAPTRGAQPAPQVVTVEPAKLLPQSWRNPFELDAEYILIRGGKYKFSATGQEVEVPNLYFAKYPVTNKLYRRFIAYLAGNNKLALRKLPLEQFARSLLTKAARLEGFASYLGKNPREWRGNLYPIYYEDKRFNGDDQPVVGVSWFAAMTYCHWLTEMQKTNSQEQKESLILRLPIEQEWEWAVSGGKRKYPWGIEEPDETRANYGGKVGQTTPVGSYPAGATPEGLMDMAGNVWEVTENFYGLKEYPEAWALRGGDWYSEAGDLRGSRRLTLDPGYMKINLGFRVCASASQEYFAALNP